MNKQVNCILFIDDDEATNFLHRAIVEEAGFVQQVQIAFSGKEALEYLEQAGKEINEPGKYPFPDIIFLDLNMPAMDGWEFLATLSSIKPKFGNVIIIMLTTSLNPDDQAKAAEMGSIHGFVTKPLDVDTLKTLVSKYLN